MKILRWFGVLLGPPLIGLPGFLALTLLIGDLPYSGVPGTAWLGYRRILDAHIVPLLVAATLVLLHLAMVIGAAARRAVHRGQRCASWPTLLALVAGYVLAVEEGLLRTPLSEWPEELPVACIILGLPCLGMLWATERLAFGPRTPPAAPAGAI